MSTQLYKPFVTEFESRDQYLKLSTNVIESIILENQTNLGIARIALAGGNTPLPIYNKLSRSGGIEWSNLEVFLTDERNVLNTDEKSNSYQIKKALTPEVIEQLYEFHEFRTDLLKDECLADYQIKLDSLDDVWFELCVIGIGADGHVASLFRDTPYLRHQEAGAIATLAPEEYPIPARYSLTIESILNSREIIVLLDGQDKMQVLTEMLEGKLLASQYPAKFLLSHPKVHIYACFD